MLSKTTPDGDAAHLREAAFGQRIGTDGSFQGVEEVAASSTDDGYLVAVGADGEELVVGDGAGWHIGTNAAAIRPSDVGTHQGAIGIGHQVAEIGFAQANNPDVVLLSQKER